MKKLVAITALGLSLGFSALTFASEHMDLYTNGPSQKEVSSEARGGEVETSPMSFYLSPFKVKTESTLNTAEGSEDDDFVVILIR